MRVAIDIHSLTGPQQGIGTYTRHIVEEAAVQAPEIEFVLLNAPHANPVYRGFNNLRQVDWDGGVVSRVGWGARRQTRLLKCSAYHTSYWLPVVLPENPLVTIHDVLPNTHPRYFNARFRLAAQNWFRYSALNARHVFTVSAYSRNAILELYGLSPERISITPCAVDFEYFSAGCEGEIATVSPQLKSQNYFLMVGRFDPRKDHATALQAYAGLCARYSDLPLLVLAGSHGPMEAQICERITQPDLVGRVVLLKGVSYKHLPILYAHALCSLSPSVGEGFGIPSLEAMAAGSPVICADNTAQTELVKGYGQLFNTGNSEELAEHMLRMATDTAFRRQLRANGLARARAYTWRAGAQALVRTLRDIGSS